MAISIHRLHRDSSAPRRSASFSTGCLPEHHLTKESKEIIHLGIGVIVTLTAPGPRPARRIGQGLVRHEVRRDPAGQRQDHPDRSATCANTGRKRRKRASSCASWVDDNAEAIWIAGEMRRVTAETRANAVWTAFHETIARARRRPTTPSAASMAKMLVTSTDEVALTRWLLTEQAASTIQTPFLLVLVLWLGIIFASFGLFAAAQRDRLRRHSPYPRCPCRWPIFLVLELDQPFDGTIRISDAPFMSHRPERFTDSVAGPRTISAGGERTA